MCEKGGGLGGDFKESKGYALPSGAAQLSHMFRDEPGHLPDTPANRQLIVELVNDENNRLGIDHRGLVWYAKNDIDGSQLWASIYKGIVQNCGRNDPPRPWDDETGLSKSINNIFKRRK